MCQVDVRPAGTHDLLQKLHRSTHGLLLGAYPSPPWDGEVGGLESEAFRVVRFWDHRCHLVLRTTCSQHYLLLGLSDGPLERQLAPISTFLPGHGQQPDPPFMHLCPCVPLAIDGPSCTQVKCGWPRCIVPLNCCLWWQLASGDTGCECDPLFPVHHRDISYRLLGRTLLPDSCRQCLATLT